MKKLSVGILAHVDAGKTTLSEAMLYACGEIRKPGRVDNKDAYLDTHELEKERGITIFSKQAVMHYNNTKIYLIDTPGHMDFSAEMERTLQVLDMAILVISAGDGVQGHTKTLWKLLEEYDIPTFLFVNKMDQPGTDKEAILENLHIKLSDGIVDFTAYANKKSDLHNDVAYEEFLENIAGMDEEVMEHYFSTGEISENEMISLIFSGKIYPCLFGSALKQEGVTKILDCIDTLSPDKKYPEDFGARVYKISRDEQDNRLTHIKITGGSIKVKDVIGEEKINEIRIYSGNKYENVKEAGAGDVCALCGLNDTKAGIPIGAEEACVVPVTTPVLTYGIVLPEGMNTTDALIKFNKLQEEEPELQIKWNDKAGEIQAKLMGEIQIEILKEIISKRFHIDVDFTEGNIVYKETIEEAVEGVGHFEPLKHYAEVHLLLEPMPAGSGIVFDAKCSEDKLDKNWQRLIMTHLQEKTYKGVLTGSDITDMKITLIAGRAHAKHTEGGDFREATYRAVRQGLREAKSILLEPYYEFTLDIPSACVGRAIADLDRMSGTMNPPETYGDTTTITGVCPVSTMRDYHMQVISYSRGYGKLNCNFAGYDICHNEEEIIESFAYDPEADLENPTSSVFCAHGAGYVVPWNEVKEHMHVDSGMFKEISPEELEQIEEADFEAFARNRAAKKYSGMMQQERELEEIFARTYGGIKNPHNLFHTNMSNENLHESHYGLNRRKRELTVNAGKRKDVPYVYKPVKKADRYLIVDGYNVIFAWEDLRGLATVNIDSARDKLIDILSNYQYAKRIKVILVFDAYKVTGNAGKDFRMHNIRIVYTKENQTADTFIEQLSHNMGRKHDVTVATSDGLEQVTVLSQGCKVMSSKDLKRDVEHFNKILSDRLMEQRQEKSYLLDNAGEDVNTFIENLRKREEQ